MKMEQVFGTNLAVMMKIVHILKEIETIQILEEDVLKDIVKCQLI